MKNFNSKIKYTLFGVIFGCFFPIMALSIDIYRLELSFSWNTIILIQTQYPVHFIINTAPFILGIIACFAGDRQDKIKVLNKNLQKEIEKQTSSLRKSTKQLKASLHFKDIFWANMSHEIRTPMNGIIGMLNIIQDDKTLSPKQKDYIDIIYDSSLSLMDILNDVLDLSKMEENKMQLKPSDNNIHEVINQVRNVFLASAQNKGIQITYTINTEIHKWVNFDKNRFSQIISNLIGNAIKFTKKGSINIELEPYGKNELKNIYKVSITDTGIGLNEQDQKVIFDEFYQLEYHNSLGSGLGLTICKKLVNLMGGEIAVNSELGKGSTFWFTFEVVSIEPFNLDVVNKNVHLTTSYNLNVLLVEDNLVNQKVAILMLKKLGCKVEVAQNGFEAITLFSKKKYDLIFMDVQMPVMDGIAATKELKKKFKDLPPIIGLSANALKSDVEKYMTEGMDDYISKPILIDDLNFILKKWFDSSTK